MPIETAQKEGTKILVENSNGSVAEAAWRAVSEWQGAGASAVKRLGEPRWHGPGVDHPVRWLPIPRVLH